jgi:hypothetical protein
MKACSNCLHSRPWYPSQRPVCVHPEVWAQLKGPRDCAEIVRKGENVCGFDGAKHEPKGKR